MQYPGRKLTWCRAVTGFSAGLKRWHGGERGIGRRSHEGPMTFGCWHGLKIIVWSLPLAGEFLELCGFHVQWLSSIIQIYIFIKRWNSPTVVYKMPFMRKQAGTSLRTWNKCWWRWNLPWLSVLSRSGIRSPSGPSRRPMGGFGIGKLDRKCMANFPW